MNQQEQINKYASKFLDLITAIKQNSSRNNKEHLLAMKGEDEDYKNLVKQILYYTYNPQINYFSSLKELTESFTEAMKTFDEVEYQKLYNYICIMDIFHFVNKLATREFTGYKASVAYNIYHSTLPDDSKQILNMIINRTLGGGVGISTINKVFPNLIPDVPYMRCSQVKDMKPKHWETWAENNFIQVKMDGMFCNVVVYKDPSKPVDMFSRSGSPFTDVTEFMRPLFNTLNNVKTNTDIVLHGELILVNSSGETLSRETGNGVFSSILNKPDEFKGIDENIRPVFVIWDVVNLNEWRGDVEPYTPYSQRLNDVDELIQRNKSPYLKEVETYHCKNLDEANTKAYEFIARGEEGGVFKNANGLYRNTTSRDMVKIKVAFEVELEVTGFEAGTGKNSNTFGSITCQSSDGKVKVSVSSSGIKDKDKIYISENRDNYIGKILTVRANNLMKPNEELGTTDYSLFLPVFVGFRDDKHTADSLQEIVNQMVSAKKEIHYQSRS